MADQSDNSSSSSGKPQKVGNSFASFVGAILAILAFRWLLFEPFVIPSGSMIPTLLVHDHILVSKSAFGIRIPFTKTWLADFGGPKRGEVIVFKSLEGSYFMIKRVIGLPGDSIEMQDDGMVKVNGQPFEVKPLPVTDDPKLAGAVLPGERRGLCRAKSRTFSFSRRKPATTFTACYWRGTCRAGAIGLPGSVILLPFLKAMFSLWGTIVITRATAGIGARSRKTILMGKALFIWLSCEETLPYIPFICNPLTLRWMRFFHVLE